ncbi:aspartyl-phosphate phosphatase Spo0E family protein [Bacillus salacetis]|uniref:Aspartyl-phosphate phosphatase Spo0E family protein n=1 Tax=Bacillus salacetis TaxID=2315464 RepID=A0A3A1R4I9_9BACI|nr:aspartyl-phosphate phosphatase Spo0E family protein [Bacillus salacetis]RIW35676.1 aspartyl-phosphate phosphatase Spo0E family protein [Bacillus salacetis]
MGKCQIYKKIEETRARLFMAAARHGLDSETTIKISQELDVLINHIQRKKMNKEQWEC